MTEQEDEKLRNFKVKSESGSVLVLLLPRGRSEEQRHDSSR